MPLLLVCVHAKALLLLIAICTLMLVLVFSPLISFPLCVLRPTGKGKAFLSLHGHELSSLPSGTSLPTSGHSSHRQGAGVFVAFHGAEHLPCHWCCRFPENLLPASSVGYFRHDIHSLISFSSLRQCSFLLCVSGTCWMLAAYSCLSRTLLILSSCGTPYFSFAKVAQAQSGKYQSPVLIIGLFSKSFGTSHKTFTLS